MGVWEYGSMGVWESFNGHPSVILIFISWRQLYASVVQAPWAGVLRWQLPVMVFL